MLRPFHAKTANELHQVFCIPMKFSALVDITKNEDCKKIFEKLVLFVELYHFKNVIFTHYASLNMLKFLLNF